MLVHSVSLDIGAAGSLATLNELLLLAKNLVSACF
jgi:hypothetical protein